MIDSATFFKRKHWTLLAAAVLAGCATTAPRTGSEAPTPTSPWPPLRQGRLESPSQVSDSDLQAGFVAWRSSCARLKTTLGRPAPPPQRCQTRTRPRSASSCSATSMPMLRAGGHQADGLITGYYEPIYPGSLTRTDKATVPVYGTPDDLVVVQLDSLYPELKGKRLRGRVEGKVLSPMTTPAPSRPRAPRRRCWPG